MTTRRASFAFDGVGGQWEWFQENDQAVALAEVRQHAQAIALSDGPVAESDFLALIRTKLKLAQQGLLVEPDDGRSQLFLAPGVMEIKWGVDETQWRLYYSEPLGLQASRVMLGLRFNIKPDLAQQDADIHEAARRWTWWQAQQNS